MLTRTRASFFSLYVVDVNTPAARALALRIRPDFMLTPLHELELANAIELAVFRKYLSSQEVTSTWRDFEADLSRWPLRPLPGDAFARALAHAKRHTAKMGSRSLDVLHFSSAVALRADGLLSFDVRQRKLARGGGSARRSLNRGPW